MAEMVYNYVFFLGGWFMKSQKSQKYGFNDGQMMVIKIVI